MSLKSDLALLLQKYGTSEVIDALAEACAHCSDFCEILTSPRMFLSAASHLQDASCCIMRAEKEERRGTSAELTTVIWGLRR